MENTFFSEIAEEQYATTTTETRQFVDVTPNPRLLESLRDMGYDNYEALLDIGDNSVDSLKNTKNPFVKFITKFGNNGKGNICIVDNGTGMTETRLKEALRLGSDTNKIRNGELGFFGVGLKGASISIGRGLKIITKHIDDDFYTGIFDLDIATSLCSWKFVSVEKSSVDDIEHFKDVTNNSKTGTVVEIYKLDRIRNRNKTAFDAILLKNIAVTYRYFISGKDNTPKIKFTLNNKLIEAIDPMGADVVDTRILNNAVDSQKYQFDVNGQIAEITVRYYYVGSAIDRVYPTELISPRNNGIYVMRNHRQIMAAQKFDFKFSKMSSDHSNFRAEFMFDGKYDEILSTNVMKTRIILPQTLKDLMNNDVTEYYKQAKFIRKEEYGDTFEEINEDVLKDTESIVKQKNESKSTPTVLTDKNGTPIKKEIIDDFEDDILETEENGLKHNRKKETDPRAKKKFNKIDIKYVNFGEDSSFFNSYHQGNGKYLISINVDHKFYHEFARLDRQGRRFIIDILHSFSLASRSELYTEDLSQIDELIRTWSNFLRRELTTIE